MSLKSFILNILFPIECLGCQSEGSWLCEKCFRRLKFNDRKYTLQTPNLKEIFIAGDYDDKILADLIKKFKFNFIDNIALILGRYLSLFWQGIIFSQPELKATENILLIPLPLSKKREHWRGFNQAELIAKSFNAANSYQINLNLKKIKDTKTQSSLGELGRGKNIKDCFFWVGDNLTGQTIILIDDIVTTGATMNEAAKILKEAGAGNIYGLVIAKG